MFTLGSSYENGPLLAPSGEDLLQHTAGATDLYCRTFTAETFSMEPSVGKIVLLN